MPKTSKETTMIEAFENLEPYLQILWGIALFASTIFLVQNILVFAGGIGGDSDFDSDSDGDGHVGFSDYFTFRNFINFLLGFSWSGIALYPLVPSKTLVSLISCIIGILFVSAFIYMMYLLSKLAQDNTMDIHNAVGKTASVYLTIPGNQTGKGKIHVSIQDTLRELEAVTEGDTIPTGSSVKVTDVADDHTLKVVKN